jgi:TP901 family phage tail tape measure protein
VRNSLVARFVLTLQDRLSGPLGAVRRRIEALRQLAGRVALVSAALAGLSVAGPVREAAAYEGALRGIAITAGATGAEVEAMMAGHNALFRAVALETNQRQTRLAAAANVLVSAGGAAAEHFEALIPLIGRVATAAGASAEDIAATTVAMLNNLRLAPDQVEQAFATLVAAGKEGRFELRDMAREFDSLTAAAAGVGLTGARAVPSLAAALQVARQGAGSASEAANNLSNILQKMTAPDAVRNFRDMGVDIEAVLRNAADRGMNPFEVLIQKIREATGGDMFRVQELFADSQVLGFLRPMIQQTAEYIRIRDEAAAASPQAIQDDMESRMRGLAAALERLGMLWERLTNDLGPAAETPIRALGDALLFLSNAVEAVEGLFPGLIGQAATFAAGAVALSAAIAGIGAAAGPLKAALAALASPFLLLGAAVVGIAWYIHKEWERFSGFFAAMGQGLSDIVTGFIENIAGLLTGDFARGAEGTMKIWRGVQTFFSGLWGTVRTLFEDFGAWLDGWTGGAVTSAVEAIRGAFGGLAGFFEGLLAAIAAPFESFIGGVTAAIERLRALVENLTGRFREGQEAQARLDAQPRALGGVQQRQAAANAQLGAGFYGPSAAAAAAAAGGGGRAEVNGRIVVEAAPGTVVREAEGTNPNVPIQQGGQNRGATRSRP